MRLTKVADGFLAGKEVATSFAIALNLPNRCVLGTLQTNLSPLSLIFLASQLSVFDELSQFFGMNSIFLCI